MMTILKSSLLENIIIGAIGSILGYLLILMVKKIYGWGLIFNKNVKQARFEEFKRTYIDDAVETQLILQDKVTNPIMFTKLLMEFVFYMGILIICTFTYLQILIVSLSSTSQYIKIFSFLLGFISSYPTSKLGYIRGGFKVMYRNYIDRKSKEIGLEKLEELAIEKYNSKH